ncbi:hypothetical protein LTR53_005719 [Teratosphaeriaceae sp. CCFEE 6253]|nr:hypothetical protein LTR53_005719 [Teratosphaeriaceae sp. CCFEE 6253]
MATPAHAFQLRPDLFNHSLYTQLHALWYRGQADANEPANQQSLKRWFSFGLSPEEKDAFDGECRAVAGPALASIAPSELELPPFTAYDDDLGHVDAVVAPFLAEVNRARQDSESQGASTLLALALLLDQMPRNMFRQRHDLPLVYNHYDRLAWTLVRSTLASHPQLFEQPSVANRKYWMWLNMPLVHSEHLPSHRLAQDLDEKWRRQTMEPREGPAADFAQNNIRSITEHTEVLERFGRYPHRNQCLGRADTKEEEVYSESANTFGVKQEPKANAKDEL